MRGKAGRPRRLSPDLLEVRFTQAQSDALRQMFADTGTSRSALVREALQAYLVRHGYLPESIPTTERNHSE